MSLSFRSGQRDRSWTLIVPGRTSEGGLGDSMASSFVVPWVEGEYQAFSNRVKSLCDRLTQVLATANVEEHRTAASILGDMNDIVDRVECLNDLRRGNPLGNAIDVYWQMRSTFKKLHPRAQECVSLDHSGFPSSAWYKAELDKLESQIGARLEELSTLPPAAIIDKIDYALTPYSASAQNQLHYDTRVTFKRSGRRNSTDQTGKGWLTRIWLPPWTVFLNSQTDDFSSELRNAVTDTETGGNLHISHLQKATTHLSTILKSDYHEGAIDHSDLTDEHRQQLQDEKYRLGKILKALDDLSTLSYSPDEELKLDTLNRP